MREKSGERERERKRREGEREKEEWRERERKRREKEERERERERDERETLYLKIECAANTSMPTSAQTLERALSAAKGSPRSNIQKRSESR